MPKPMRAYALGGLDPSCRYHYNTDYDPDVDEHRDQQRYLHENLQCSLKFFKDVIPAEGGRLEGVLVIEPLEDVGPRDISIVMKGLPQKRNKKKRSGKYLKYSVVGGGKEGGIWGLEEIGGTYPLDFDLPKEMPTPLITLNGELIYRVQLCISTYGDKHMVMEETPLRWQGCRVLTPEDVSTSLKIEQLVESKRSYLKFGRRKRCLLEWKLEKGGYLPGEVIEVELMGENKDKLRIEVGFRVELVQKVWFENPSRQSREGKMWVELKVNVIAALGSDDGVGIDGGEERKLMWCGRLKVPRGITPTVKFDYVNSISYTVRVSVGVAGERRRGWVTWEVPVVIGSSKEFVEPFDNTGDGEEENGIEALEEAEGEKALSRSTSTPYIVGGRGCFGGSRSKSLTFLQSLLTWKPKADSVLSIDSYRSLAASRLSVYKMPPSFSDCHLLPRKPAVETPPPPPTYSELKVEEHSSPEH